MEYSRTEGYCGKAREIPYHMIESLAMRSNKTIFRSAKFRKAMINYRRRGLRQLRPTGWTLKDACYFARNSYQVYEAIKKCTEC